MEHTIQIETGKCIELVNVASFRKKMKQTEIQFELDNFVTILKDMGAQKKGPVISAVFGVEMELNDQISDMEFIIPIDKEIELPQQYKFKPKFNLVNAIYSRFNGNPIYIQNTYNAMMNYINTYQLNHITVAYNVNVEDRTLLKDNEAVIDVYIGINPNII